MSSYKNNFFFSQNIIYESWLTLEIFKYIIIKLPFNNIIVGTEHSSKLNYEPFNNKLIN